MPEIRLALSEEQYQQLIEIAKEEGKGVSIQDIIRKRVFGEESIFTPAEAVNRALNRFTSGNRFTLSDLYSNDEWQLMGRGVSGVFGRKVYKYIEEEYKNSIKYIGTNKTKRQAEYEIV